MLKGRVKTEDLGKRSERMGGGKELGIVPLYSHRPQKENLSPLQRAGLKYGSILKQASQSLGGGGKVMNGQRNEKSATHSKL